MSLELTHDQLAFIRSQKKRIFLNAVPGAGKTTALLHKLYHVSQLQKVLPLYLAFNNSVVSEIRDKLANKRLTRNTSIKTLHSFALQLFVSFFGDTELIKLLKINPDLSEHFEEIFIRVIRHLKDNRPHIPYTHIFVDEIQDLTPLQLEFLSAMITNTDPYIYVAGDLNQAIYNFRGVNPMYLMSFLKSHSFQQIQLSTSFRITPSTAKLIHCLFQRTIHSSSFSTGQITLIPDSRITFYNILPTITYWLHEDSPKELQKTFRFLSNIGKSLIQGHTLGIIAPTNHLVHSISTHLNHKNVPHSIVGKPPKIVTQTLDFLESMLHQVMNHKEKDLSSDLRSPLAHHPYTIEASLKKAVDAVTTLIQQGNIIAASEMLYALKQEHNRLIKLSAVNVATVHQSKGLEFDTTIVLVPPNFIEKLGTQDQQTSNMLYVALTRHKHNLNILSSHFLLRYPECKKIFTHILKKEDLFRNSPKQQRLL